ncbi:MAG TPA: hypothetical protein P5026_05535 [Kiritimatiellia bacterium]|nr:hypothetical protein [Kiritimatiellia bacterium]
MRKLMMFAAAAVAAAGVALAASYSVISVPEPGTFQASGLSVGKLKAVQIEGAYPTNSTVVISRVSDDGSVTNALLTRTDVDGSFAGDIGEGTNIWIMAGDKLLRSGTVTNTCRVRLILEGD